MKYQGWNMDNHTLEICFEEAAIVVNQQDQKTDAWNIVPLSSPQQVWFDTLKNEANTILCDIHSLESV